MTTKNCRSNLSPRTQIRVYYSTAPAAVGYADTHEQAERALADMMQKPAFVGTVRAAHKFACDLTAKLGQGVFINRQFRIAKTGAAVTLDDLERAIRDWDDK